MSSDRIGRALILSIPVPAEIWILSLSGTIHQQPSIVRGFLFYPPCSLACVPSVSPSCGDDCFPGSGLLMRTCPFFPLQYELNIECRGLQIKTAPLGGIFHEDTVPSQYASACFVLVGKRVSCIIPHAEKALCLENLTVPRTPCQERSCNITT